MCLPFHWRQQRGTFEGQPSGQPQKGLGHHVGGELPLGRDPVGAGSCARPSWCDVALTSRRFIPQDSGLIFFFMFMFLVCSRCGPYGEKERKNKEEHRNPEKS